VVTLKKLKIGLVGVGRRAQAHLPVIAALGDVYDFVAVCDMNPEAAKAAAEKYGTKAYTSVETMVEKEKLDVVDLTTPGDSHHAFTCFLAEMGINVIVETPIAITLPLADLMINSAKKAGVKLEVAENYYRAPSKRFRRALLDKGVVGEIVRIYRIFQEVGYHGMSWVRVMSGGSPKSIMGVTKEAPIVPVTDRMKRHHTSDSWNMGIIDFDNGVIAITMYSNIIHAGSLGRRIIFFTQIDGAKGTIVNDEIHIVKPENLELGGISTAYPMKRVMTSEGSKAVLERIEADTEPKVVWENPFKGYPLSEHQISIADELWSIAKAVLQDAEPEYGPYEARKDMEMGIAIQESARQGRKPISLPLTDVTEHENRIHRNFREKYGVDPFKVQELLSTVYPRV